MFNVEFYEKSNGDSEVWNFLEELRLKSKKNKDARIQYKQIILYIELLQENGTYLPNNITKHIQDGIWELRPGNNRVLYFLKKKILLFCFMFSVKKLKKHLRKKLKKQNQKEKIILTEKEVIKDEKLVII